MSEEPKDTRGPAIVIHGTLTSGFKDAYGPFESIDAACKWVAPVVHSLGSVTVYLLKPPLDRLPEPPVVSAAEDGR